MRSRVAVFSLSVSLVTSKTRFSRVCYARRELGFFVHRRVALFFPARAHFSYNNNIGSAFYIRARPSPLEKSEGMYKVALSPPQDRARATTYRKYADLDYIRSFPRCRGILRILTCLSGKTGTRFCATDITQQRED